MNNDEQTSDAYRQMAANECVRNENSAMDEERRDRALLKRLRRKAASQDLTVVKSRRRDRRFADYGRYWLVEVQAPGGDWRSRWVVAGGNFGLSLDELERALKE